MSDSHTDYKQAYERQLKARIRAEDILESKSRELYEKNLILENAYNTLAEKNAQLLHQEKLASIGQLAAGVAHEINNPIGFVKSNLGTLGKYLKHINKLISAYGQQQQQQGIACSEELQTLQQKLDIDFLLEDIDSLIDESLQGTDRVEEIVKSLKAFAHRDEAGDDTPIEAMLDLNTCINNTIKLVWNELKYKCELSLDLQEIPMIKGSSGQLCQVIVNLLMNASQAIEESGTIQISTALNDRQVVMQVSDDGHGMTQAQQEKIFDPFYTTKEQDKGTGLGLSISHGIIHKMGGEISVSSTPGEGSCFSLTFPVDDESLELFKLMDL